MNQAPVASAPTFEDSNFIAYEAVTACGPKVFCCPRNGLATCVFDPKSPGDFELRSEEGVVLWGEAWGLSEGQALSVSGEVTVRRATYFGEPVVDVLVQRGAQLELELRIPAVDVVAVAPNSDMELVVDHVQRIVASRVWH